jgi:hypothetical protein
VTDLPGLRFEGITGYEGHCSLTVDDTLRLQRQREAMTFFTGVADLLESAGIGCPIRSAGGIATWQWTAAFPGITEIQAGTYVVMDHGGTPARVVPVRRGARHLRLHGDRRLGAGRRRFGRARSRVLPHDGQLVRRLPPRARRRRS